MAIVYALLGLAVNTLSVFSVKELPPEAKGGVRLAKSVEDVAPAGMLRARAGQGV